MSVKFSRLVFNISITSILSISSFAITTSAFAAAGGNSGNSKGTTTTGSTGTTTTGSKGTTTTGSTGSTTTGSTGSTTTGSTGTTTTGSTGTTTTGSTGTTTTGSTGTTTTSTATSIGFSATGTNTYNNSNGELSASVLFNKLSNGMLSVTLSNTALKGISDPSDVLTSVFWDYAGSPLNLTYVSATAPTVVSGSSTIGTNVDLKSSNEWQYKSTTSSTGLGGDATSGGTKVSQQYGLGTAGLGIFQGGTGQQFNYGVINGYASNANKAVKGGSFVEDTATFMFSGLATDFDVSKIGNVRFQYGTNLAETSITGIVIPKPKKKVPEPSIIFGLSALAAGSLAMKKKNSNSALQA